MVLLRTTDKGYWIAHRVFREEYTPETRRELLRTAFPTLDDAVSFHKSLMKGMDSLDLHESILERATLDYPSSKEERQAYFYRTIETVLDVLPPISETGVVQQSPTILIVKGTRGTTISTTETLLPSKVRTVAKAYIVELDKYAQRVLNDTELKPENFHTLREQFAEAKQQRGTLFEAWKWAFITNEEPLLRVIAADLLDCDSTLTAKGDLPEAIARLTKTMSAVRIRSERMGEKERERATSAIEKVQVYNSNIQKKDEELAALRQQYMTAEGIIAQLSDRIRTLETGTNTTELEQALFDKELAQEELGRTKETITFLGDDVTRWKDIAEHADDDIERLRRTITELWEAVHSNNGKETPTNHTTNISRRETYAERFQKSGLDYDIVEAIMMGGFKGASFVGESYIPVRYVKTNSFGRLQKPEQVPLITETLEKLVRCNAVILQKKGETISINPHVKEIVPPALKEYVAELLTEAKALRKGK